MQYSCYPIIATLLLLYDIVYHQLINYGKAKTVTVQEVSFELSYSYP